VGLTILNVILLNEFPDYRADSTAHKANLVVRLGRRRASLLYALLAAGSWVGMLLSFQRGAPLRALWLYTPVFALSLILTVLVVRQHWQDRQTLEKLCGANILVNLGTTAVYILAFLTV
jgi:1,4-dihydroxy-2-naphthoate octaprenyltransferase